MRLPLQVWLRTQEHVDGLLREFALIAQDENGRAETPGRLLALVRDLTMGYGHFSVEQQRALDRNESE